MNLYAMYITRRMSLPDGRPSQWPEDEESACIAVCAYDVMEADIAIRKYLDTINEGKLSHWQGYGTPYEKEKNINPYKPFMIHDD